MDRRRLTFGLAQISLLVALSGDVAMACSEMTPETCCCEMMDAAPCRDLAEKRETSDSARDDVVPTRPAQVPAAVLAGAVLLTAGGNEPLLAESPIAAVAAAGPPLYLRHCSLLN